MLFKVHYSDDQVVDLNDIPTDEFVLNVWSTDSQAVAIVHKANEKLEAIALRDNSRAYIKVQLRSAENCADEDKPPLAYNQALVDVQFSDAEVLEYDEERECSFLCHHYSHGNESAMNSVQHFNLSIFRNDDVHHCRYNCSQPWSNKMANTRNCCFTGSCKCHHGYCSSSRTMGTSAVK